MPHPFQSLLATALLLVAVNGSAAPPQPINALWNDGDGFGIWIYPGPGTCPEVRDRLRNVLIVGPRTPLAHASPQRLALAQLKPCMQLNATTGESLTCKSGVLALEYRNAEREYWGSFDFILSDGTVAKGEFRAQYCKKSGA